jgi:hypothetical protein
MKTFLPALAAIFLLCFVISGCKKDKDNNDTVVKKNVLKIGTTEYEISKGILEPYDGDSTGYNIDLSLVSSGITIGQNASGTGNAIYFEMYSANADKLSVGDYVYNDTYHANSLDYAEYVLNWNFTENLDANWTEISTITVKVIKNSPEYELSFSGTDMNNLAISGYYKGALTMYGKSGNKKSLKTKRFW